MRNASHKTKLSMLMKYVERWKQQVGSRESIAVSIVEKHYELGLDVVTGITFKREGDAFTQAKNAADRIFRWLDDKTKDTNLMPVNFEHSLLAAMPDELLLQYLNEVLLPVGFVSFQKRHCVGAELDPVTMAREQHKESSEATTANLALHENSSVEALEAALKENLESLAKNRMAVSYLTQRVLVAKYGIEA